MTVKYSDIEISEMIQERKPLTKDYLKKIQLIEKRGHKEQAISLQGLEGNHYQLRLRQSITNPLDFSVILAFNPLNSNVWFRLRRCNGKSHEHTNRIERNKFYDYHIHQATERYQEIECDEEAFAEPTDRYADFHSALQCLIQDCGFILPEDDQLSWLKEF